MKTLGDFSGPYRFLSNFYPAPVVFDELLYPTVEHAYQAAKTLDGGVRYDIAMFVDGPGKAKLRGQSVNLRKDWEEVKLEVMRTLIYRKFEIPVLRASLIDTGNIALVEGNSWGDTFWGVYNGEGENHLGKLLMECRTSLQTAMEDEQTV